MYDCGKLNNYIMWLVSAIVGTCLYSSDVLALSSRFRIYSEQGELLKSEIPCLQHFNILLIAYSIYQCLDALYVKY